MLLYNQCYDLNRQSITVFIPIISSYMHGPFSLSFTPSRRCSKLGSHPLSESHFLDVKYITNIDATLLPRDPTNLLVASLSPLSLVLSLHIHHVQYINTDSTCRCIKTRLTIHHPTLEANGSNMRRSRKGRAIHRAYNNPTPNAHAHAHGSTK